MNLGLAIFLSAVFLGIIVLFIATKDRWNWRKIVLLPIKSAVWAILVLSILGGIGLYVNEVLLNRPKLQTSFWGISLDSTEADVKFTKGTPTDSSGDDNRKVWHYKQMYSSNKEANVFVRFEGGKVRLVFLYGTGDYREPDLQGIRVNDNLDKVSKKFGQASEF